MHHAVVADRDAIENARVGREMNRGIVAGHGQNLGNGELTARENDFLGMLCNRSIYFY
jgi:hypothetical protein